METAYCRTAGDVLDYFQVSSSEGLSSERVERGREKYGLNGKHFFSKTCNYADDSKSSCQNRHVFSCQNVN